MFPTAEAMAISLECNAPIIKANAGVWMSSRGWNSLEPEAAVSPTVKVRNYSYIHRNNKMNQTLTGLSIISQYAMQKHHNEE